MIKLQALVIKRMEDKARFFCEMYGKESACNARDLGSIPGLGRYFGGGHGNLLQQSCLENPHGRRSLVGYSPWSPIELDMDE